MHHQIVIGSRNPVKIEAVRQGFSRVFPARTFWFEGVAVPSGVPDQPMNDEDTRRGALNRAIACRQLFPTGNFYVGLEGGVEEKNGDIWAFAWMAIITDQKQGEARTSSFKLPPKIAELIRSGMELGDADDQVFGTHNSKQKGGAVGLLTHQLIDRTAYYREAIILALIPFVQPEFY
ncbi:MAG: inosine/xanthosine triphosphatase [Saprospiraceae bacterium]|nr:inosine/xanthosine triphosphatase [Saprospiraceae bacterium]